MTAVGDGQDALEEFQKHRFDLVILTSCCPVRRASASAASSATPDVPIIMLTAKGEVEGPHHRSELGADDYGEALQSPRAGGPLLRPAAPRARRSWSPSARCWSSAS